MTEYIYTAILHSVKKQVQLHFSCTAVSSEDSSATDLLMHLMHLMLLVHLMQNALKDQLLMNLRMKQLYTEM